MKKLKPIKFQGKIMEMHKVSFLTHIRMPKISAKTYAKTVLMQ